MLHKPRSLGVIRSHCRAAASRRLAARAVLLSAVSLIATTGAVAQGLTGGTVTAGSAAISAPGSNTTITQTSRKAVIDWQGFSIGSGETVRFVQPGRDAVTLNRVVGGEASRIDGALTANGQVWLLNPNGVLVGSQGQVSAAGFLATTRALSDADFLAGRYTFGDAGGDSAIGNAGRIVADNGYAVLAGSRVANSGLVQANLGQVVLGGAKSFTIDLAGDKLLSFAVTQPLDMVPAGGAVASSGTLRADGGRVVLSARAAASVVDNVVNTSGLVQARSVRLVDGAIILDGGSSTAPASAAAATGDDNAPTSRLSGSQGALVTGEVVLDAGDSGGVHLAGRVDVSGSGAHARGGHAALLGHTIILGNDARIDASGAAGGGAIHVGGGWQGAPILGGSAAVRVGVASGAVLDASATEIGDGGTIVLWSDVRNPLSQTSAHGSLYATGGAHGGDGGRIETSGHALSTAGVRGSTAARLGRPGTWLFDPYDIEIVSADCACEGPGSFGADASGSQQWTATGGGSSPSYIHNTTVNGLLDSGSNVIISTTGDGAGTAMGNIQVTAPITKSSGGDATLSLIADNAIIVGAAITSSAGRLNLDFKAQRRIHTASSTDAIDSNGGAVRFQVAAPGGPAIDGSDSIINDMPIVTRGGAIDFILAYSAADLPFTRIDNSGNLTTAGGAIRFIGGNATLISTFAQLLTTGGNVSLTTGDAADLLIDGVIDTVTSSGVGGQVLLSAGQGSDLSNYATIAAGTAPITLQAGADSNISNFGSLDSSAGGITLQAGARSLVNNNGSLDTSAGAIRLSVGDGNRALMQYSQVYNSGTITSADGAITLSGGADADLTNAGTIASAGGATTLSGGAMAVIFNDGAITTGGGAIHFNAGDDGYLSTGISGGSLASAGGGIAFTGGTRSTVAIAGTTNTAGGTFAISGAELSASISGAVTTTGGDIRINAGLGAITISAASSAGAVEPGAGAVDAGAGAIVLVADHVFFDTSVHGASFDITTGGFAIGPVGRASAANTIILRPSDPAAGIRLTDAHPSHTEPVHDLIIDSSTLSRMEAPTRIIGHELGSGSISIALAPTSSSSAPPPDPFLQTTLIRAPQAGGTISFGGFGRIDAGERLALTAGSQITLAADLAATIAGNLDIISGAGFRNDAGANALPTASGGRWFISLPALAVDGAPQQFNGLASGNHALWGVPLADATRVAATVSGNRYIFGEQPTLSIAVGALSKTYGDALAIPASAVRITGLVDAAAYGGVFLQDGIGTGVGVRSAGAASSARVGAYGYDVDPSFAPAGYRVSLSATPLEVTARPLLLSLTGPISKTYDGTTAAVLAPDNFVLSGFVDGEGASIAATAGSYADRNAGTAIAVTAMLTAGDYRANVGTDLANYRLPTSTSGAVGTILPRPLLLSLTGSIRKTYDGTTAVALDAGSIAVSGFVAGESASASGSLAGAFAAADVASDISVSAAITAGLFAPAAGTLLSNYALPSSVFGRGSITPATLTYVATPAIRRQATANPLFSGSVTGFVAGDTLASATTGTLAFTSPATAASPAGQYAIEGSGLAARNYSFVQAPANATALTVTAAEPLVDYVQRPSLFSMTGGPSATPSAPLLASPPDDPQPGAPAPETPQTSQPRSGQQPAARAAPDVSPAAAPSGPADASDQTLTSRLATQQGFAPPAIALPPLPPSPVGNTPPPTPVDAADAGDAILAAADETGAGGNLPSVTIAPGIQVQALLPPRTSEVPGLEARFSATADSWGW